MTYVCKCVTPIDFLPINSTLHYMVNLILIVYFFVVIINSEFRGEYSRALIIMR